MIEYKAEWNIPNNVWDKFNESIDFESDDKNFKYDFKQMTSKFGRQYMEHCRASWIICKDYMSINDFCKINANMPIGFFKAKIDIF